MTARNVWGHALLVAGGVLYAAGAALPFMHGREGIAIWLRWVGLACFAFCAARRRTLTPWILLGMLAGAELGLDRPALGVEMRVFSDIFLRLIRTIVAPLILGTLITGIAGHGDLKGVGRIGIKALVYFEAMAVFALAIGLLAINLTQAGAGLSMPAEQMAHALAAPPAQMHWQDFLLHLFPDNIAQAIAEGHIMQVALFALIFGAALATVSAEKRAPLLRVAESLSEVMFRFTNIVMWFAPVGVAAAMAYTVGHMGLSVLVSLAKLLATLYGALLAFGLLVMLPMALLARVPVRKFLAAIAAPASIAFGTATSEAALPRAMENMEAMGVPRRIVAFMIPMGYSFNLAGSTLYLSLASIFVAQAAGIHMPWAEQLLMMATLMLTSKGVAGVPRASLVVLLATAATFHLPTEPILVILGIDTLMDMARTMVNVVGNCLATVLVARWEGEFPALPASAAVIQAAAQ